MHINLVLSRAHAEGYFFILDPVRGKILAYFASKKRYPTPSSVINYFEYSERGSLLVIRDFSVLNYCSNLSFLKLEIMHEILNFANQTLPICSPCLLSFKVLIAVINLISKNWSPYFSKIIAGSCKSAYLHSLGFFELSENSFLLEFVEVFNQMCQIQDWNNADKKIKKNIGKLEKELSRIEELVDTFKGSHLR